MFHVRVMSIDISDSIDSLVTFDPLNNTRQSAPCLFIIFCVAGEARPASRCVFVNNPTLMNVAMRELDADHPSAAH